MSKLAQARIEIATVVKQIQTDWLAAKGTPLVVETDNGVVVDQASQFEPYLKLSVRNLRAEQLDLGVDPFTEQRGQILFSACARGGDGTADGLEMLDFVAPYFAMTDSTLVRCHTFQAVGGKDIKGWWYENAVVNYWYIWRKLG